MEKIPHVIVVAFPAQGHVAPLIAFSYQLVDHGVRVTFVNTEPIHQKVILDHKEENKDSSIQFVSVPDGLNLDDRHMDSRHPLDVTLDTMHVYMEELVKKMISQDGDKIDCILADATAGRILEVAEKFKIRGAAFWPASLSVLAFMLHFPKLVEAGYIDDNGTPIKNEIVILPPGMAAMTALDLMWGFSSDPFMKKMMITFILEAIRAAKVANWMLCNSFNDLESASHDFIPNVLSVGPLLAAERLGLPNGQLLSVDFSCLRWLDQQPLQSVTYIAFGSTTVFNQNQFDELAHGLELLNQPFLWVFRPGLTTELSTTYSDGFKDRISPHGKVVDWAPQLKVLAHPSIACFITLESISMGVPLLCWPYVADQFHNQNYICDIWKVGLKFNKDENGIISRSEIKMKVHQLLSDEGIRLRVNKLKDIAKTSIDAGGSSTQNLNAFIDGLKQ